MSKDTYFQFLKHTWYGLVCGTSPNTLLALTLEREFLITASVGMQAVETPPSREAHILC